MGTLRPIHPGFRRPSRQGRPPATMVDHCSPENRHFPFPTNNQFKSSFFTTESSFFRPVAWPSERPTPPPVTETHHCLPENLHCLLKNLHFLLKNLHFLLKNLLAVEESSFSVEESSFSVEESSFSVEESSFSVEESSLSVEESSFMYMHKTDRCHIQTHTREQYLAILRVALLEVPPA